MKIKNQPSAVGHRPSARPPGFTLIELLMVVSIIVVLASTMFVVGKSVMNSSHRARTLTLLKNLDNIVSEWQDKMGNLRIFTDNSAWVCPGTPPPSYRAFAYWDPSWQDAMPTDTLTGAKLNSLRFAYALTTQGNCKNMLSTVTLKYDGDTPGAMANNYQYIGSPANNKPLPADPATLTNATSYLYVADSYGNPVVLMQTRLPAPITTVWSDKDTPGVARHSNKLYFLVSCGPDGKFGNTDDIYSDSP